MKKLQETYIDKTVLVTGHTGFKGSWLSIWLKELGANVIGYSVDVNTEKDNFILSGLSNKMVDIRGDIRDIKKLQEVFNKYQPEFVFHLAAQPIVLASYNIPVETYEVNLLGTINILECIKMCDKTRVGIFITTDKCYENKEQLWGYKEEDLLGGSDPYSSSKACAEIVIKSWRESYFNKINGNGNKLIASVRAGNVIGGGDWSKDRIIPDCIRALEKKEHIVLRNPDAIRPWQHVLEPLSGYLLLGKKMEEGNLSYNEAWNFGPYIDSVVEVKKIVRQITKEYGIEQYKWEETESILHETKILNLDISKSVFRLGWKPRWSINEAIKYTCEWYKNYYKEDVYELCKAQINAYMQQDI